MNATTTAALLALGLALATTATAQTAAPDAGADAAAPATGAAPATPPVRGAPAVPAPGATSVEGKANAAGSAVATGIGEVAPGQLYGTTVHLPEGPLDLTADHMENGRWYNAEGIPTFKIENGELDYASFSGYRRYHAECHVCHGPDGEGSTYAPALKDSVVKTMDYYAFQEIVASGKKDVNKAANLVMPAFGTNRNVWCYVDDIYAYLLARGTDAIPRGRPAKKASKSDEFAAQETACMEG